MEFTGLTLEERLEKERAQFKHLCEYGYTTKYHKASEPSKLISEDSPEENNNANQATSVEGDGGNMKPEGSDDITTPQEERGEINTNNTENDIPALDATDVPDINEPMSTGSEVKPTDNVVSVDDLTNAQEKVNSKVNTIGLNIAGVEEKMNSMMQSIDSMTQKIESSNQEIANLQRELEKRNPTETEKLNLRYQDSFPFNVHPDDYFNGKVDKNAGVPSEEKKDGDDNEGLNITQQDVDELARDPKMKDSFDVDESLHYDMKKIFEMADAIQIEEETVPEDIRNAVIGKMVVYHFSNGNGTVGIRVQSVENFDDNNTGTKMYNLIDTDGTRMVVLSGIQDLINHNPKSPSASFWVNTGGGVRKSDSNGFAVLV